ncbi:MAG: MBOAT family protein [Lachnospiraceae bacterium]|nr:MBOAT family protein [Lachnospiraceae bacterium]
MQFNSVDFMIFFPVVVGLYFIVPKKIRMYWLLIASYYFYMSWNATYALLIGGSTLVTYVSGLLFSRLDKRNRSIIWKRLIMILCICVNLAILFLFKYGNFGIDTVNAVLSFWNIDIIKHRFDFLLPVGISFYTFQALGYMIDVYRGDVEPEKNIFRYALFVSFFPQLVAGPIERSKNLLNQMRNIDKLKLWNARRVTSGAILMIWGLFMKMVIADRVSILVDTVFNNYRMYGSTELILAAIGFTLQIYCDFGSYSMIAIGAAKVMGFELMENFKAPYLARSIREFWSRWHISLSTWFRDYLYIPLGGNRKGAVRKSINIMIVFLVSGLWHGANWSFVVWGGIHGLYQVIGDILRPLKERIQKRLQIKTDCFSWHLLQTMINFSLVTFAWIFFRADTISEALGFIGRIFTKPTPWLLFNNGLYNLGLNQSEMNILFVSVLILFAVDYIRKKNKMMVDAFLFSQNMWFEWFVIIGLILMIVTFGEYGPTFDAKQFIYFQF